MRRVAILLGLAGCTADPQALEAPVPAVLPPEPTCFLSYAPGVCGECPPDRVAGGWCAVHRGEGLPESWAECAPTCATPANVSSYFGTLMISAQVPASTGQACAPDGIGSLCTPGGFAQCQHGALMPAKQCPESFICAMHLTSITGSLTATCVKHD